MKSAVEEPDNLNEESKFENNEDSEEDLRACSEDEEGCLTSASN